MTRVLGVVPVRLGSSRLPGKALLPVGGRPLFAHVALALAAAHRVDRVVVATDAAEVVEACRREGLACVLTAATHRTGSERCAEVAAVHPGEVVIDAQGDWPEVAPADLDLLAGTMLAEGAPLATLVRPLRDEAVAASPHVVKAVGDHAGRALYFSRAPIPHAQHGNPVERLRHVGVYAFRRDVLLGLAALPPSALAEAEGLEQLRFLAAGIPIRLLPAAGEAWGIETRADYEALLARRAARP